jgi:arylsulfatase A-like enzyme
MIREMDEGIGRVLNALDESGIGDDTLVIFTSDNGGERFSDNWPLVGGKMDLTEGGIRVPCIARWPKVIKPRSVSGQTLITMDWTATMLAAAGVAAAPSYPMEGISLLPFFKEPQYHTERALYWRMNYRRQRALREGQWKYLAIEDNEYLFDLADDERERANLAKREPERLQAMREKFDRWSAEMRQPHPEARSELVYTEEDMPRR